VITASPDDMVAVAPRSVKGTWAPEEDAKLIDGVAKCGHKWVVVAALVQGRTNVQCVRRWA
jgi:hypothetical protein